MWPKISLDTIWVEPFCVTRVRRYKRLSRAFQKQLQQRAAPPPPRYTVDFDIRLKPGVEIEAFGHEVIGMGTGGGFAVWPQQRRIKGSVHTDKSQANAVTVLESAGLSKSEAVELLKLVRSPKADDIESSNPAFGPNSNTSCATTR